MLYEYGDYCIYLRKSRADYEAELRGEGETLARHEKNLMDLSHRLNISIKAIYREVVSGETITARPFMQQLLHEVEAGLWDGVLVMEVERLARGDTIDQGIVSRAFQFSGTKIITPTKIYDPQNEFDEEYFEFGLFMSRREYKTIKRRLTNGRIASVNDGLYVGNKPPYGYTRVKLPREKGFTLEPIPEEVAVVRMIYDWYVNGCDGERLGMAKIARKLNDMGIPAQRRKDWVLASISGVLTNPVYIGKVRWNHRRTQKQIVDGQIMHHRPRASEYIIKDGRHPAIISEDLFQKAQLIKAKNPPRPANSLNVVRNPLSGLVYCSKCGRSMVRRPYQQKGKPDTLYCSYTSCSTVASQLDIVERAVIDSLWDILSGYKLNLNLADDTGSEQIEAKEQVLKNKESNLQQLDIQKGRLYDLLEQGIYTTEIFLERSEELKRKTIDCKNSIESLKKEIEHDRLLLSRRENFIPQCEHILEHYWNLDVKTKNDVLKELIEKIEYTKDKKNKRGHAEDITFSLKIHLKVL